MKLGDLMTFGLIGGALASIFSAEQKREYRSFRCWLCRTETRFMNVQPGYYHANCHYCELPCRFELRPDSPRVIQSVQGPFPNVWSNEVTVA